MSPNVDIPNGKNLPAFQRNVFRSCKLVVMVMGTDSRVTNLIKQSEGSRTEPHKWMSLIPRFPKYQLQVKEAQKNVWLESSTRFPCLKDIAMNSRGRFARNFIDGVVQSWENGTTDLCDLMDEAFAHVLEKTQIGKKFLNSLDGKVGQKLAVSYSNAEPAENTSRPRKKFKKIDDLGKTMHRHFANLIDKEISRCIVVWNRAFG
ncbi:crinkler (CRN) family protein [Thraustotheca clavata]|uniref:Crinkler (CRN) family protein n=1 Tax=Thraustotheca clavata TaxID=74557 RepID=A0A1V9YE89_9STRA|nr:crinkler (CRN) family protein [Thraustotheca clavata]